MSLMRPTIHRTSSSDVSEDSAPALPVIGSNLMNWRILGGIFATFLVIGWIFIIVILIQEEKWQLVLVAWLLLYAAAHFCYWYFKRHHLLSIRSQICRRVRGNGNSTVEPVVKGEDDPPSYEEILKSEIPPPAYYSVVMEAPKTSTEKKSPFILPKVFGRSSSPESARGVKVSEKDITIAPVRATTSVSISATMSDSLPGWKVPVISPPAYVENQQQPSTSTSQEPILEPIFKCIGVVEGSIDDISNTNINIANDHH